MKIMMEFYRTRTLDDAHAALGREAAETTDLDNAIETGRLLSRSLDMSQRADQADVDYQESFGNSEASTMTLTFPNPSRSFDEVRDAVRFIGHDGMFQVRFFVEAAALSKSDSYSRLAGSAETRCLAVFDALRGSIQDVARKAYSHSRRDSYTLTDADFR